jgi:hypothetical protein
MFAFICLRLESLHLPQNGPLHSDTKTKANILNEQFQKAFTPATDDPIPNKGQSTTSLV